MVFFKSRDILDESWDELRKTPRWYSLLVMLVTVLLGGVGAVGMVWMVRQVVAVICAMHGAVHSSGVM